jgi:hypothetical protein
MRFWFLSVNLWLLSFAAAWAVPSAMTFTTDAPGNTGSLFFVRSSYVAADKYPGAITLTVTDAVTNWATTFSAAASASNSPFYFFRYDATVTSPTSSAQLANATGSDRLKYGTHIISVTSLGSNAYSFLIHYNGKGENGSQLVLVYEPLTDKIVSSNSAFIDGTAPESPVITAPIASSNQINYIGRSSGYTVTASANYSNNSSYFLTTSTLASGNTDTYKVDFFVSSVGDATWSSNATLVGTQSLSSSVASATANFVSSNVRLPYLGAVAYDAAGNPTVGTVSSANLLDTKWLALGKIRDDHNSTWYGDTTFAGNWQSSANLTAGSNVSLSFYAVNYYGDLNSTFSALGNVELASSIHGGVPSNGFDGSVPDVSIGTGNVTTFSGNGIVTYSGCVNLYRQEDVRLGSLHDGGTLWAVDSPIISVKHNLVNDIVYVGSGNNISTNYADSILHSSGNGLSGNGLTTLSTAVAGTSYNIKVAMVDRWLNLCKTTGFGRTDTVTLGSNANDPFTAASNINTYRPYGASSNLTYTMTYPGAYTWSTNGSAGVMELSNTFYVEESGNVQLTNTTAAGVSADNILNNAARFSVTKASSKVVYFDGSPNYAFSGNLEGNYFAAGNVKTVYAHITDIYGNHYTADSTTSVTFSANTSSGNGYVQQAYRNDGTVFYNTISSANTASNGIITLPNVRFDRATTAGNTTYFPYTSLALTATLSGNTYQSESLGVLPQAKSRVFFANTAGEPLSSANTLGTSNGMTSGNAIAGTAISVYAAVGDTYGNIDLTATDNVGLVYTALNSSPSGNTPINSGNTQLAVTGTVKATPVKVTPVKLESSKTVALQVPGLTGESSALFNIGAGTVSVLDFVTSSGLYASGNSMVNNVAGNAFLVYAAGLDAYYNTNPTYGASAITVVSSTTTGNTIDISPAGNASTFTAGTSGNGYIPYSVTIYDAKSGVRLAASASGLTTKDSEAFTISANTSNSFALKFVDSATLSNDTMKSTSTNVISSFSGGIAGNAITFHAAELDHYGNVSGRTGANITLASHTTTASNVTLTSLNTISSNTVTFASNTITAGVTTFSQTFYVAENDRTIKVQDLTGSANTSNFSPSFNVLPNTMALANFTTSTGAFYNSTVSGNLFSSYGIGEAVSGIYVGVYDNYGNKLSTGNTVTGSVNIGVYTFSTNIEASGNYTTGSISLAGNLTNNVVYFDPGVDSKKVTISAAGNYFMKIVLANTSPTLTSADNSRLFYIVDKTPPVVKVLSPNGGEKLYAGTWNASWTVLDSDFSSGTYDVSISFDSGTTWESASLINSTANGTDTTKTATWTASSNMSTERARIRVRVTDNAGNIGEDTSDADFSITPSTQAIAYVVGDTEATKVNVNFREPVYSNTGAALGTSAFAFAPSSLATGLSVSHTAGASVAQLTFAAAIGSTNINSTGANVGLASGNVSKYSSGASAYTSTTEIASRPILQLVATPSANMTSSMTASSNQRLFGLKLVGWTNNTELKRVNVRIDSVGGVVTADDFGTGSNTSITSGISLLDASGNVVTLSAAPTIGVGSIITLSPMAQTLGTNALTGSANFNYYVSVATSSTISDVVPDSFKVSVLSVEITDTTSGTNVYNPYVPYGTLTTDPIVADITAPAAPLLTIASSVNSSSVAAVALSLQSEANSKVYYTYTSGTTSISSNTATLTGNGLVTTAVTTNLSALPNGNVTLTAYGVDSLGNSGNTQGLISTKTIMLDTNPISSSNVTVSMSNVTSLNSTAVALSMTLKEFGVTYTISFHDGSGNTYTSYNGTLGASSNVLSLTGIDLSALKDTTSLTANVLLTDMYGNATTEFVGKTVTKDVASATLSTISVANLTIGGTAAISVTPAGTESAILNVWIVDSVGTTVTVTSNTAISSSLVSLSSALTTLVNGRAYAYAKTTDANGNVSATIQTSFVIYKIAPVLSYVVGELDSANAIAVFDKAVFANDNGTGALQASSMTVTGLTGISTVSHAAGDSKMDLTFGSLFNSANVNSATLAAKTAYGDDGNALATTAVIIHELASKDKVSSTSPLTYGGNKTVVAIQARAWSGNTVKIVGFDYTIVPVNGSILATDFSDNIIASSNIGVVIAGVTTGTFGSNQTLTLSSPVTLSASAASTMNLVLPAAAATSSVIDTAKVVKVQVNKVLLDIDGVVVSRLLAGKTTTSNLSLTNVGLTSAVSSGSSDNLRFTVGQTITLGAGNVSSMASYTWTQTSGNALSIMPSANSMSFIATEVGQFGFKVSYSLDGHSIEFATSTNITINSAASAGVLGLLSSASGASSFTTKADFDQGFSALAALEGGVNGQTDSIATSANALVTQLVTTSVLSTVSSAQVASLLNVVDQAISSGVATTSVTAAVQLLNNVKSLPALSPTQVQQTFKILTGLNSTSALSDQSFLTVNVDLAKAGLKSLVNAGGKTITADVSSKVKTVIERLFQGETNTLNLNSGASILSVTMDSSTLSTLAGSGDNVALYAVKMPALASSNVTLSTVQYPVSSAIYEISLAGFDKTTGAFSDVAFKMSNFTTDKKQLSLTMSLDKTPVAGKAYKVIYSEDLGATWTILEGTPTQAESNGVTVLSFKTPHLTQFAIIETDAGASTSSSGGGGGCLLK